MDSAEFWMQVQQEEQEQWEAEYGTWADQLDTSRVEDLERVFGGQYGGLRQDYRRTQKAVSR